MLGAMRRRAPRRPGALRRRPRHPPCRRRSPTRGGSRKIPERTNSFAKLYGYLEALFRETVDPARTMRKISIGFGNLVDADLATVGLFTDVAAADRERRRAEAVLAVKEKFGKNALIKGTKLEGARARSRAEHHGGRAPWPREVDLLAGLVWEEVGGAGVPDKGVAVGGTVADAGAEGRQARRPWILLCRPTLGGRTRIVPASSCPSRRCAATTISFMQRK